MTIPTLVTFEQACAHLKITPMMAGSPLAVVVDQDIQLKLDAATQLVCEYIADRHPEDLDWIAEIEAWDPSGSPAVMPPPVVMLAILEQTAATYRFRGDDANGDDPQTMGYLRPSVENLLSRYKNRSFA